MFEVYTNTRNNKTLNLDVYDRDIKEPIEFTSLKKKLMPYMLKTGDDKDKQKFKDIMRIITLRKRYFAICDIADKSGIRKLTAVMKKELGGDLNKIQVLIEYSWLYDKAVNIELFDHILAMKPGNTQNFMCNFIKYLGDEHCQEVTGVGGTNHSLNNDVRRFLLEGEVVPDVC